VYAGKISAVSMVRSRFAALPAWLANMHTSQLAYAFQAICPPPRKYERTQTAGTMSPSRHAKCFQESK
jgi:hypothetical protein